MSEKDLIACGMYAPNGRLQKAWSELFANFRLPGAGPESAPLRLAFDPLESVCDDSSLLFAHTCGYPLMKKFADSFVPFAVPVFDLPGADGKFYTSRFIAPAESGIESLQDCRGKVVAINGADSNSGMNVLRYALARTGAAPGYFAGVITTGGHLRSIEAVAGGKAQLAAIDCVSYRIAEDCHPQLTGAVKSLGFSAQSCGLPFVLPARDDSPQLRAALLEALRQALRQAPREAVERLHLAAFEAVDFDDYRFISGMEGYAISAGYPELS